MNTGPIQRTVIHDPPLILEDVGEYDDEMDLLDIPPPDWITWEERCKEAEPLEAIRYAALAIGRHPNNQPVWAVETCVKYFKEHDRAAKSRRPPEDGELLDKIGDLFFEDFTRGRSVNDVIRTVVAELRGVDVKDVDHGDSEIRRLRKLWDAELVRPKKVDSNTGPYTGLFFHPRFERAAVRSARRKGLVLFESWEPKKFKK